MQQKYQKKGFCFWDNCIWISILKLSLWRTRYFSSAANMLTNSPKILHVKKKERLFPAQLSWQWSMNMIKVLWCRFQQWLGTFTMLLVEGSCETGLLIHLSNHVFRVRKFPNRKAVKAIFLKKRNSKFNLDFKNEAKNLWKSFLFLR